MLPTTPNNDENEACEDGKDKEREKTLESINKLIKNYSFDHLKPKMAQGMIQDTTQRTMYSSTLDQKNISLENHIESLKKNKKWSELQELEAGYLLDHDYEALLKQLLNEETSDHFRQ